jgi:hypothetical protein
VFFEETFEIHACGRAGSTTLAYAFRPQSAKRFSSDQNLKELSEILRKLRGDTNTDLDHATKELNRRLASRLVVLNNHPHRKDVSADTMTLAKNEYFLSLRAYNLCEKCQRPLRMTVTKAEYKTYQTERGPREKVIKESSKHAVIPEHYRVFDRNDRIIFFDNTLTRPLHYSLISEETITGEKCQCR